MLEGLSDTLAATFGQSKTPASRRALDFRLRVGAHPALTGRALYLARSSGPRMLRTPSSLDVKGL